MVATTNPAVILAVDDENENADMVRRAVQRRHDLRSVTAGSGDEALLILSTTKVDVMVLDQRMPRMTGVELLERAQQMDHRPTTIMLTAYPEDGDVLDAQKRGLVECVLAKPWAVDDLLQAIDRALAGRR